MTNKISRQLLFNYITISIIVLVFIASVFYINQQYQTEQEMQTSIDLYKFEEDYLNEGLNYALSAQGFSKDDHILILNSGSEVIESRNMTNYPTGKTMTIEDMKVLMSQGFVQDDQVGQYYHFQGEYSNLYFIIGFAGFLDYNDILQQLTIGFAALFVLIIVFYANVTSRKIASPIHQLVEGVSTIAKGDYGRQITFESNNELMMLKEAVNTMSTDLEKQRKQEIANQRAKQQFIINISHDIRTPLTNIIGYSDQLLSFEDENIKWRPSVEVINQYGHQASDLVNNLFELSRMEFDDFTFELHPTDVVETLRQVFIQYLQEFEDLSIDYDIDLPDQAIICRLNPLQFERVINNLIQNSIKYNKGNFTISLSAHIDDHDLIIKVKDNGIGIPKAYHATIFDPLVRVEHSRNRETGGSGLGLSIVREIIEKHHGNIQLNQQYSDGAEFMISLPLEIDK